MIHYCISKYKDLFNLTSFNNKWTAMSDIGKTFENGVLTLEEYKRTEDLYIKSLFYIIEYMKINSVSLKGIEDGRFEVSHGKGLEDGKLEFFPGTESLYDKDIISTLNTIHEGELTLTQFEHVMRLSLRANLFGFLYVPYRFKAYVRFDFIMYADTSRPLEPLFKKIEDTGLYIFRDNSKK